MADCSHDSCGRSRRWGRHRSGNAIDVIDTTTNRVLDTITHPAQLNRYDWVSATNWSKPYPGDDQILAFGQVPSRNLPSDFLGD
ncbi:hypothetical protein [Rugosimonospora africana]|uniref:Uncharacterized protein n=1 Tax=Rugosimonospora africana TaxID=556532 RepID=A0A8J3VQS7_9ACTN|nr:hypothetical protein [Rugosimonospora africana]GIH15445.1 hypothetical protein Raf01_36170 [Rugosimonospora africana]